MDPYHEWALKLAQANPNFSEAFFNPMGQDYNYGLAFQNDPSASVAGNGHLPDLGKMPNHPTFSNESVYAIGSKENPGKWVEPMTENGQWLFHNPSRGLIYAPEDQAYRKDYSLGSHPFMHALTTPTHGYTP